jgi:hypothetical protein
VYHPISPPVMDLTRESALKAAGAPSAVTPAQRFREALSYPRIVNLSTVLRSVAQAPDPWAAFQTTFFSRTGVEYRCADGTIARDFDVVYRGDCRGFRFDGSSTFANLGRLTDPTEQMRTALSPSGQYVEYLRVTNGEPNGELLERLVGVDRRARENGGELILVRPPLLPGFEAALSRLPGPGAALARTDAVLAAWARRNRLAIINAGRSENFGCVAGEFIDAHHAVDTCFEKVFAAGWPAR